MQETEMSSKRDLTYHFCGWTSGATHHGLRIHQEEMGCAPTGRRIPESNYSMYCINSSSRNSPGKVLASLINIQEPLLDPCTNLTDDTDSEASIMDDMAHSMAQLDVTGNAETPSASPSNIRCFSKQSQRRLVFSTDQPKVAEQLSNSTAKKPDEAALDEREKDNERTAQKVLKETRARQKKLTEVKSSLKDYTEHLAAEGLEIDQVFSEVMKIVEDTLQRELKWRYTPPLPSIMMGNVRSIVKKMNELAGLVRTRRVFRESSVLCLTETWLREDIPDSEVTLDGFHTVRADRSYRETGKTKGGGLAILINNKWCHPGRVTVEKREGRPNIELLAVSLRPYYLPSEFSDVIILVVYITNATTKAKKKTARDVIHRVVAELQTAHPDAFIAISGDFNHVTLADTLPTFTQFVDYPTRKKKTLDLLYANVKEAYCSIALPPLGKSDHNLIHLQPLSKPLV